MGHTSGTTSVVYLNFLSQLSRLLVKTICDCYTQQILHLDIFMDFLYDWDAFSEWMGVLRCSHDCHTGLSLFHALLVGPSSPGNHHKHRRQTQTAGYSLNHWFFDFLQHLLFSASILLAKIGQFFLLCSSVKVSELRNMDFCDCALFWNVPDYQKTIFEYYGMKKSYQNSWDFNLVCQKAFNKHIFVENVVSFSVMYFLLKCNIMKHMPIDNQAQGQFKCDFMIEKNVALHVQNKQLRKHHVSSKLIFKN